MSDIVNSDAPDDVSAETLEAKVDKLFIKQLANFACPVCHKQEFLELELRDKNLKSQLMFYEGDDPIAKKHVDLRTIACVNCGKIEQFAERALIDRIASGEVK